MSEAVRFEGDALAYSGRITRTLRWQGTKGVGRPVAGFKQVSDVHVVDSESPGRVEFFDQCSFGSSAYRPHESLSTQVGESMIRALNAIDVGPATGADLDFAISTGDNIDNNQRNELAWFIDLMNGDMVTPNSGALTYDGYTQAEIASLMDVPAGTVASWLSRAKAQLREALTDD